MEIRAKDFIETREGLIFAVLVDATEQGRYLCFLRYIRTATGFTKLATDQANQFLSSKFPRYRYHSQQRDADLHGVPGDEIERHYQARQRLQSILSREAHDPIEAKLKDVAALLGDAGSTLDDVGVTGSLLIGAQSASSDIDLLIYGREHFDRVRAILRDSIASGKLDSLSRNLWLDSYRRRACSLDFDEYLWHEKRKDNKAAISGTKIDFSLIAEPNRNEATRSFRKLKRLALSAVVTDHSYAFDHPARYSIDHSDIREIVSFTPTYAGQARRGERVEVQGSVEQSDCGLRRIVVGSSRESPGEYIKVAGTLA